MTVGDFDITDQNEYFLRVTRRAQGALFAAKHFTNADSTRLIESVVSGSVAKGRFARNKIDAIDSNQGPYRLAGENNELYIMIIAGTERVYIDGRRLQRGLENDYIIDYNLAEIVFTANQPVNRNKRIVVEFEYSDRNYPRFMLHTKNSISSGNSSFYFGFFSEHDAKNQPIQHFLNYEQKDLLASIGDSLSKALVPKIDSVEFSHDFIMYKKTDTLVNSIEFNDVFVHSANPAVAHFRLNFTYLGENRGNYVPSVSSANGRVFKWVPPVNGNKQGTHEPVIQLVTPKKQQVLNFGAKTNISKNSRAHVDLALSNTDLNMFSTLGNNDNTGLALRIAADQIIPTADTSRFQIRTKFAYELTGKNFSALERFRPVEFERDWNINLAGISGNENLLHGEILFKHGSAGESSIQVDYFNSLNFEGFKNTVRSVNQFAGFKSNLTASYLSTTGQLSGNTNFMRHKLDVSRQLGPMVIGFVSEVENNSWEISGNDSLLRDSFKNNQVLFYLKNADSKLNAWRLEASRRNDYIPLNGSFAPYSVSKDLSGSFNLLCISEQTFRIRLNYRIVDYKQGSPAFKNEDAISGRLEYNGSFLNGAFTLGTFMESISGREHKKEFFYVKVNAGQGIFKWIDYNGNGLKELDEFEIAGFPDEADHIRLLMPTNYWIQTQINQIGQTLNLQPSLYWRNAQGLRKFISKFSNQTAFRANQKTEDGNILDLLKILNLQMDNPFIVNLNANFRNTLAFNRANPEFGADYTFQKNWSKILLVNGADRRQIAQHGLRLRWSPMNSIVVFPMFEMGMKNNYSEFFTSRNYKISQTTFETTIQYNIDLKIQLKMSYRYSMKENLLSVEESNLHEIVLENLYTLPAQIQLNGQLRYSYTSYNAPLNNSIAYEMLEGLNRGKNINWTLFVRKSLPNNLELTINYNGRVSKGASVIHTGGIQARAFF